MIGDIARVLQCMALRSFVSKVSRTIPSTTSSVTVRGTPGRGRAARVSLAGGGPSWSTHRELTIRLGRDDNVALASASCRDKR